MVNWSFYSKSSGYKTFVPSHCFYTARQINKIFWIKTFTFDASCVDVKLSLKVDIDKILKFYIIMINLTKTVDIEKQKNRTKNSFCKIFPIILDVTFSAESNFNTELVCFDEITF